MAIQKHEYELSIWEKELVDGNTINEIKLQVIGAHDMTHLGRATNVHFKKLLNGTHVLTFQMPIRFFNSEVGDYVQNELIENLFNEQKIKLKFKNKWYEMVVKSINEKKNFKSVMKDFTCSDGFIDELSRTGYDIYLDPEANNSVNEIHDFMEETLENSIWDYRPEWNWGDFTEYKEERFYKIPLSLFGGSISAYKLTLDVPKSCLTDNDIKEIKNVSNYKKRPLQYGDDLAGVQKCFWNQQDKSGSALFKDKVSIITDYIYIPMSDLTSINTQLYENLDSAAQSTETYYDSALTKYALQPTSNNPKDIIQFIILPENDTYMIDDGGVLIDYNHTYILTIEDFNNQCKSKAKVYYKNGEGQVQTLTSNKYSLKSFMWKPLYNEGYLSSIGEKEVTKARKVSITGRTELNVYDDIYVNVYNDKVTDKDITPLLPKEITSAAAYENYRIVSKLDTEMILPTLARNYVLTGKTSTDTTGWESLSKDEEKVVTINSAAFKQLENGQYKIVEAKDQKDDTEIALYAILFDGEGAVSEDKGVVNFGFIGAEKTIEKDKTYALRIQTLHKATSQSDYLVYSNVEKDLSRITIAEGSLDSNGNYTISSDSKKRISFKDVFSFSKTNNYILFKSKYTIKNPYVFIDVNGVKLYFKNLEIFEAYTRGEDLLEETYLELRPNEDRASLPDNYFTYKYTGRNIDIGTDQYIQDKKYGEIAQKDILLETDITLGNAYGKQTYFIQEKKNLTNNVTKDTFLNKEKWFEEDDSNFSNTKYVDTDFECNTYELNLNQCNYLDSDNNDCSHTDNIHKICYYKKYGFCPFLFNPELHPRRIRTLQQSKSNRFNIIQELSKIFEVYPTFTIPHTPMGKVSIKDGKIEKYVHFITEKGNENLIGFRYTKNLTDINRTLNSDSITTKLIVAAVDSQLSKTGYCTIQAAKDNLGKNSFIFDFSYYTKKGLLNPEMIEADLYGLNKENELAYLKRINAVNSAYDQVKSRINALTDENYKTLKATNTTNLNGVTASQEELGRLSLKMTQYKQDDKQTNTYQSYIVQKNKQKNTLYELIEGLFFTDGKCYNITTKQIVSNITPKTFENTFNKEWNVLFDAVNNGEYKQCGTVGQEQGIQAQVDELTKISNSYLKQAKELTTEFNKKYEAFIKEGTWSDSNYLTDNEYYWGGVSVLSDSSKPQTSYGISVIDITKADINNADIYEVDLADITYVEDEDFFGINKETGFANREKVLISEIDYSLDIPSGDRVSVQNYTTQFNDLFQQITASVQSLTYNENIYKRAQSFTSQHYIKTDSLQGTLNTGDLTLLNTNDSIKLNRDGTEGNAIQNTSSRYKLNGDGLFFSTNGGTTWMQAVSPKGINMDYAKFGAIDVGKIRLVDSEYVYFLWDKNGISAYKPDKLDDYVQFNKNGLSLYKNNNLRLRTGYKHDLDSDEEDKEIGFYLYDMQGHDIFSTSVDDDDDYNMSARLALKGEMFVYSDHVIPQSGYTLSDEVKDIVVEQEGYSPKDNSNNDKGKLYLFSNNGQDFTEGGEIRCETSMIYNFSILKKYSDTLVEEQKFPSEPTAAARRQGFENNAFTGDKLIIKDGNSTYELDNNNGRVYWYAEFKITAKARSSGNVTFNTTVIENLINDNEQGTMSLNYDPTDISNFLTENFSEVSVESNTLTKANRFFIADILQDLAPSSWTQKEYGNGFDIYTFTDVGGTPEDTTNYNTNEYLCLINSSLVSVPIFTAPSGKLYKTSTENHDLESKIKTAIFINKTKPDREGDTIKRRIFTIAIKGSNGIVKNMICAFNDGSVITGGTVKYNSRPYSGDLEKLPDDIVIGDDGTILVNPVE